MTMSLGSAAAKGVWPIMGAWPVEKIWRATRQAATLRPIEHECVMHPRWPPVGTGGPAATAVAWPSRAFCDLTMSHIVRPISARKDRHLRGR